MRCKSTFFIGDIRYKCQEETHSRHIWHIWEALIDNGRPAHRVEWPDPDLTPELDDE